MNYKKRAASAACFLAALSIYLFFSQPTQTQDNSQFIVGIAAGYAPFISINAQGDYEGFDIDVARVLAKQMNKRLVLKDLGSMTPLFMALHQGSVDALIWGLSITQDRLEKVAMVHYQGERTTSYPLMFWKAIPDGISTIADMCNKTVCVEPGSAQEAAIASCPCIKIFLTEKVDDALLALRYGKADAAFVEPAIAKKFSTTFPEIKILDVPLNPQDYVQGIGVVLRSNATTQINEVQKAVEQLKSTGIIKQLEQRWGLE